TSQLAGSANAAAEASERLAITTRSSPPRSASALAMFAQRRKWPSPAPFCAYMTISGDVLGPLTAPVCRNRVARRLGSGLQRAGDGEELARLARVGHAGRVAEADLLRAGRDEPAGDREDALARHVALVRAAEAHADHALAAEAGLAGARQDAFEPGQRLLDRAVDVLAVVRLARREEDVDLVEALA